jgi:hypothetical protein
MTETDIPRLTEAWRGERCWLMASTPNRSEADILDDLSGMLRYCRRLRIPPILVTDPRGVLADDDTGERLATALHDAYGEHRASALLIGWKIIPVRRIRWKISAGWGASLWCRGAAFAGHPYRGKITSREALFRWLPGGVILDPCAGFGDLIVPTYRAGRQVVAVTDRSPTLAVSGLGQGMLFDDP